MNCKVMGIVNVTPDSFSDGGKYFRPEEAIRRAKNLIADGADIIDLGGESTRPGATPIGWEEEWARVEPVLTGLRGRSGGENRWGGKVSVDTYHPETAARAIQAGADIINCVYPEPISEMMRLVAATPNVELVVPVENPSIRRFVDSSNDRMRWNQSNIFDRLYIDPMIGFGTTREEDLARLKSIGELATRGRVLVGASRKRIVKKLTGVKTPGKDVAGNVALALWAAANGASVVRVHDVRETVQALKVWNSLR